MQQPYQQPQTPPPQDEPRRKRHGRAGRVFRGYLMIVGALTTAYALERLLVILFIEIGNWL